MMISSLNQMEGEPCVFLLLVVFVNIDQNEKQFLCMVTKSIVCLKKVLIFNEKSFTLNLGKRLLFLRNSDLNDPV